MASKPKTLYHGTQKQIKDGVIHPMPAHRNNMKTVKKQIKKRPSNEGLLLLFIFLLLLR